MAAYEIRQHTQTFRYRPGAQQTVWIAAEPGEVIPAHESRPYRTFSTREAAERFIEGIDMGLTIQQAENRVHTPDAAPVATEPATAAQRTRIAEMIRDNGMPENLEGSVPSPYRASLTKAEASWWIDQLSI